MSYHKKEEKELTPDQEMKELDLDMDKAVLMNVCLATEKIEEKKDSLLELERLADTAGIESVYMEIQNRKSYDRSYYAGKGFIEKMKNIMIDQDAGLLIVDNELLPLQSRNILKNYGIQAIDRTEVILNIFHNHAKTPESRMQVELAQLKYQLPRLKRLWSHLDRERGSANNGGGGASRGMGEKQIEMDKRKIRDKISKIEFALKKIMIQKETLRKSRMDQKKVCLVGYTNAGKSTMFNSLTNAQVLSQDKLFATLDSTARRLSLEKGQDVMLSDTVGFIADLPHHLVASFRATLKDAMDADVLLHVVDCSDQRFNIYIEEVEKVLAHIGASEIPQLLVFNKVDKVENDVKVAAVLEKSYPNSIIVSAQEKVNLDLLLRRIDDVLFTTKVVEFYIPHLDQKAINYVHKMGKIIEKDYQNEGVQIKAEFHLEDLYPIKQYKCEAVSE